LVLQKAGAFVALFYVIEKMDSLRNTHVEKEKFY
jgi:hypothetical protein